jgi:hypothetical protein
VQDTEDAVRQPSRRIDCTADDGRSRRGD